MQPKYQTQTTNLKLQDTLTQFFDNHYNFRIALIHFFLVFPKRILFFASAFALQIHPESSGTS